MEARKTHSTSIAIYGNGKQQLAWVDMDSSDGVYFMDEKCDASELLIALENMCDELRKASHMTKSRTGWTSWAKARKELEDEQGI